MPRRIEKANCNLLSLSPRQMATCLGGTGKLTIEWVIWLLISGSGPYFCLATLTKSPCNKHQKKSRRYRLFRSPVTYSCRELLLIKKASYLLQIFSIFDTLFDEAWTQTNLTWLIGYCHMPFDVVTVWMVKYRLKTLGTTVIYVRQYELWWAIFPPRIKYKEKCRQTGTCTL